MFNLYAFGCSFTKYEWTTWADILGNYADHYENFGKRAAGNYFVFHQLIDFIATHDFKQNDVVAVCWAPSFREDRIKNDKWLHSGPLLKMRTKEYNKEFVDTFFDPTHYLKRDRCFFSSSIEILESKNIKYVMFSVDEILLDFKDLTRFFQKDLYNITKSLLAEYLSGRKDISELRSKNRYSKYEGKLLPPMFEYLQTKYRESQKRPISRFSWKPDQIFEDDHPTPLEHLHYVKNVLLPRFPFPIDIKDSHLRTLEEENLKVLSGINTL